MWSKTGQEEGLCAPKFHAKIKEKEAGFQGGYDGFLECFNLWGHTDPNRGAPFRYEKRVLVGSTLAFSSSRVHYLYGSSLCNNKPFRNDENAVCQRISRIPIFGSCDAVWHHHSADAYCCFCDISADTKTKINKIAAVCCDNQP